MVRNENTGKQAKGQKYVGEKKTKQKKNGNYATKG